MGLRHTAEEAFERAEFDGVVIRNNLVMLATLLRGDPEMRTILARDRVATGGARSSFISPPLAAGGVSCERFRCAGLQTCCIVDFQIVRGHEFLRGCGKPWRGGWSERLRVRKPAIQQTWKSALPGNRARRAAFEVR